MKRYFRNFPKINLVLGRKHLIIAGLTLVFGAAVAVNVISAGSNKIDNDSNAGGDTENYGEAALVSNGSGNVSKDNPDYFAQARLDKQASRDEAKEFLEAISNGGDITPDEEEVLAGEADILSSYIESETKIETVLKALGFSDILCYLSDKGANIIVKTSGLTATDAAKIKNALLAEVNIPSDKITIVEVN